MEGHGSFHRMYSWKLQLMEAMEAFTTTNSGKVHVVPTSMEVNLLPPTTMDFMKVNSLPWKLPRKLVETSMEVDRKSEIMWRARPTLRAMGWRSSAVDRVFLQ